MDEVTATLCAACKTGPTGEAGHEALAFYVDGPYPGRRIFKCAQCDARWIRHYGSVGEPHAWTLFKEELRTSARPRRKI